MPGSSGVNAGKLLNNLIKAYIMTSSLKKLRHYDESALHAEYA
jgi:hypothetical protein